MVNLNGFALLMTVCLFLVSTTILTWCFCTDSMFRVGADCSGEDEWGCFVAEFTISSMAYAHFSSRVLMGVVIILIYVDSYLFVCSTSILQVGVGLSNNHASCEYRSLPRGKF